MKNILLSTILILLFTSSFSQRSSLLDLQSLVKQYKLIEAEKKIKEQLNLTSLTKDSRADLLKLSGEIGIKLGNYQESLEDYSQAKELLKDSKREHAQILGDIGIVHWKLGNLEASYDYLTKSLSILKELGLRDLVADANNNLGLIWSETDPLKAQGYYKEALKIYEKNNNQEAVLITNNNIGIIYRNLGLYNKALNVFQLSLTKNNTEYKSNNFYKAFTKANIAQTYLLLNQTEEALQNFDTALTMYQKVFGASHPEIASIHTQKASLYAESQDFKNALMEIDLALLSNTKDDTADVYYDRKLEISILLQKAEILLRKFHSKTLAPKEVKSALDQLIICDELIQEQRNFLFNKKDKIAFNAQAREVYECQMECLRILNEEPFARKRGYLKLAFDLIEKSKSSTLLSSIQDSEAKKFGGIPKEVIEEEKELTTSIAFLELKLSESDDETENEIRAELSLEREQYKDFIMSLEKNYPKYYDLKYSHQILTPEEVQDRLEKGELFVNYFFSEREQAVIAFKITQKKYWIESRSISNSFDKQLILFRNCLKFNVPKGYKTVAYDLSKLLMLDNLTNKTRTITIIPDGKLNSIPFEALINKPSKDQESFKDFSYLIKYQSINYHFSASLWAMSTKKQSSYGLSFHCLAPIEFEENHNFPDLPGTDRETASLDLLFTSASYANVIFKNEDASETNLKKLNGGEILHVPTHGQVFSSSPEKSRLLLAKNSENEDGFFYLGEVYNSRFNYKLVSLSACQTGLGKQSKGEGVIGLSRAFIYAGAENILVSYWSVDDESTAELMIEFYSQYLNSKLEFKEALKASKVKLIENERYANPYYWAPFILIGN